MFKKKPQIKNLSPLRTSDRRKLADQIIAGYGITVPSTTAQQSEEGTDAFNTDSSPQPTLTSIRASLLPDATSSARFTTTAGPNSAPVSGTVYVGAHPGQEERILWTQYGKDPRLIPTVYTLWHNPNIVPLLHAADFVVNDKLRGGADMMIPGLVRRRGQEWDQRAKKGAVVAVAGVTKDTVPLWVGVCEVDIATLGDVQGMKGVAVKGIHWEGDELWSWSTLSKGGSAAPDVIEGWHGLAPGITGGLQQLTVQDEEEEQDDDIDGDGGMSLEKSNPDIRRQNNALSENATAKTNDSYAATRNGQDQEESDHEDPAEQAALKNQSDYDNVFKQAFLYSLFEAKKNNQPPHYGLNFPIQASFLMSNMIQPYLRYQNDNWNIKKTSWKNTKRFIKYLDEQVLVKAKDRNGGERVILDIDFDDQKVVNFQPYKLPKPKAKEEIALSDLTADSNLNGSATGTDPSIGQTLTIFTLYRASAKLVPDLLPSKTIFYTAAQISSAMKSYIDSNSNLTQSTSSPRNIKLDPFIANSILGSSNSDYVTQKNGEIDRAALNKRLLEDSHLCVPYHLILRNTSSFSPSDLDSNPNLKPKAGPPPKITLIIEKRTGTKVVTKVSGLESFFINPQILAPELQKKCAGSASVGQLVGGKVGMMEVVVQGDQRDVLVRDVLARRGVKGQWVEIIDKAKKGKK